jgi:TP901 family phage tail tape measure protein
MSATHDAGSIGFRIQALGAALFKKELDESGRAVDNFGKSAQDSSKKVAPLGDQVDKTGKAAKAAKAPIDGTSTATDKLGKESAKAAPKVRKTADEVEVLKQKSDTAGKTIGTAALGIGVAFALMASLTVGTYAKFDEAASKTTAATQATVEQQKLLKASAIEQGAASIYSAKEAAEAQTELAKAGVQVNDILGGGLSGSLALAAAGELGVARAAEIAATTLSVFGLKGDQATHVADLLAAGAGKAQGSVDDLSLGLDYVGVSFARLKIPLEDTVGTLALLASNGLLGEKAGTGLRSVISSLTAPVAKGAQVMADYGIKVFDAQGNFIGMSGAAEQLKLGLGDLDEETRSAALGAIFGAEAASAAGILYKAGAQGVEEWTEKVDDQGFAAKQAADKTNNLMGDIELLGGSFDSILIKTGGQANGVLRDMVQILIGLTDWYGSLDEGAQGAALTIGVGTAAVLLFGGTAMLAVPKIVEFRAAVGALNSTMKGTAAAAGLIGVAITAAVVVLSAFGAQQADAKARTDSLNASLDENTGAFTKNTREAVLSNLQKTGAAKTAKLLGISLGTLTDAALGEADALKEVNVKLGEHRAEAAKSGVESGLLNNAFNSVERVISDTSGELADARTAWREHKEAMGDATDGAADAVPAYSAVEDAIDGVVSSISDLADELGQLNGQHLDAREAARALEAAYDSFDATLEKNGLTLDTTTEAGRDNESALDDIASAALDAGQAIVESGGSYDQYRASLESSREALLQRINDLGVSGDEAQALADKIMHIPSQTEWAAYVNTADADAKLADTEARALRIRNLLDGIGVSMDSHVSNGRGGGGMTFADGGVVSYFASGGVREQHVAQVEQAGAMRVWAEPETGGEAYIPLATSKRGRSSAILADVAGKFGYQLVPVGAQSHASGAVVGGSAAPSGGSTVNVEIVIDGHSGDDKHLAVTIRRELQDLLRAGSV